jgi:hypothetical protein
LSLFSIIQCFLCVSIHDIGGFRRLTFNDVGREGGRGGGWGQKVLSWPSADSFAVGRRQKKIERDEANTSAADIKYSIDDRRLYYKQTPPASRVYLFPALLPSPLAVADTGKGNDASSNYFEY